MILVGGGEAAAAKRRLLIRAGAIVSAEDAPAALAIVAEEDEGAATAAVARLRARGILVNATDRPALCDFTLPAIVDRDPVLIAIGSGGASAGLAKALRQRIEALLPTSLGRLAAGLYASRAAIRDRWPDAAARRRAIDAALAPAGPLDPFAETGGEAIDRWLAAPDAPPAAGLVAMTLASPDPDDLTLRQARLLGSADHLYHRIDVPPAILDRARADAARIACAAAPADPGAGLSLDIAIGRP